MIIRESFGEQKLEELKKKIADVEMDVEYGPRV